MIDWNKPVQTRAGLKARVLATDLRTDAIDRYPVVVGVTDAIGTREQVWYVREDGSVSSLGETSENDIVNVPEPKRRFNVYLCEGYLPHTRRVDVFVEFAEDGQVWLQPQDCRLLAIARVEEGDGIGEPRP
jgi:hypothetical protein